MAGKLLAIVVGDGSNRELLESRTQALRNVGRGLPVDPNNPGVATLAVHGGYKGALMVAAELERVRAASLSSQPVRLHSEVEFRL